MSRKANFLDNAVKDNFFSQLKPEIFFKMEDVFRKKKDPLQID
jgi:hypothetical protein